MFTEFVLRVNLLPNNGRTRIGYAKQVGVHFFLTLLHPQFFLIKLQSFSFFFFFYKPIFHARRNSVLLCLNSSLGCFLMVFFLTGSQFLEKKKKGAFFGLLTLYYTELY